MKQLYKNRVGQLVEKKPSCAKLEPHQVLQIRRRVAAGESKASLSREYGVGVKAISNIVERLTWAHVHEERKEVRGS